MAGRGPTPRDRLPQRPRDVKKRVRAWSRADGSGWRFGKVPSPPAGLLPASKTAWRVWFGSWMAAHWIEDDVPSLCVLVKLYDRWSGVSSSGPESYGSGWTPAGSRRRASKTVDGRSPNPQATPTRSLGSNRGPMRDCVRWMIRSNDVSELNG